MPKKLSEIEKKTMVDSFINGITIDELSQKFNCTKSTITRHLKKGVNEKLFKELVKKNNIKQEIKLDIKDDLKDKNSKKVLFDDQSDNESEFLTSTFIELTPLKIEINNNSQKNLASIPISKIEFPKMVYMIVDNKIELKTKILKDYPDWQFLSPEELNKKVIEIYFDMKIAKRFCSKEQKVIKVPNTNVFKIVAPLLRSRGITRIVSDGKLIAL